MRTRLAVVRLTVPGLALLALVAGLALPCTVARAEVVTTLVNGQKLQGDVPKGEDIRLTFDLPEGGEPRLKFKLTGSKLVPISFTPAAEIIGPDGEVIPDTSKFFEGTLPGRKKSKFKLSGFTAPEAGTYQLLIHTNSGGVTSVSQLFVDGSYSMKRPSRETVERNEADGPLDVSLHFRDKVSIVLKRVSGDIPQVDKYTGLDPGRPDFVVSYPFTVLKAAKKGDKSRRFTASATGRHTFDIGFRDGGAAGEHRVKIKYESYKLRTTARLRLTNAPGIPLSIRPLNAGNSIDWAASPPDIAYDQRSDAIFVTAVQVGPTENEVAGQLRSRVLEPLPGRLTPGILFSDTLLGGAETLADHRTVFALDHYFIAWVSTSGTSVGLAKIRSADLGRSAFREFLTGQPPIVDPFFATDGDRISLGLFNGTDGHDVTIFDTSLAVIGTVPIGGGQDDQSAGAGAAWNTATEQFEFWAPDNNAFGLSSDLNRQFFSENWASQGPSSRPVAEPGIEETRPQAIVVDPFTGVTIVHYIVPTDASGAGTLNRRLFDEFGDEIPGSHQELTDAVRHYPRAILVQGDLYLAQLKDGVPFVERYGLLR